MKKLLIVALVLGLALVSVSVNAQEKYVGGGFEASGHIVTGLGYQYNNNKTNTEFAVDSDGITTYYGPMGKYIANAPSTAHQGQFTFFVDEVELDLMKSFGENIRFRADLDFGRATSSGLNAPNFVLEQAYATANIPLGNGIEFLLGRFNTPMGFESADVADNDLLSKTILVRALRPMNTTGAKIYYAFSDLVDLHFYVVNTLTQDTNRKVKNIPSLGARLGFNWGSEGTESTIGISPFFGPETTVSNKHFTFGADLDFNWWATESFAVGGEALYRRDDAVYNVVGYVPDANNTYMAALLNLHYVFSDVWDGTLRYSFAKQFKTCNGATAVVAPTTTPSWMTLTGAQQSMHEIALGGSYAVADGAKFKLEGRFDMVRPSATTKLVQASSGTEYVYGAVVGFVYDF